MHLLVTTNSHTTLLGKPTHHVARSSASCREVSNHAKDGRNSLVGNRPQPSLHLQRSCRRSDRLRPRAEIRSFYSGREGVIMPAAMVDADYVDFDSALNAAEAQGPGPLLLLFLANRDSVLGKSWCPDCVRAEPVIYKVADGVAKPVTLLRIYVGDRPTWRNSEHPLRKDPRFRLKGVPTLIRWENGRITARLEDNEAHLEEKVRALIS